jgi:hypothetical protein
LHKSAYQQRAIGVEFPPANLVYKIVEPKHKVHWIYLTEPFPPERFFALERGKIVVHVRVCDDEPTQHEKERHQPTDKQI